MVDVVNAGYAASVAWARRLSCCERCGGVVEGPDGGDAVCAACGEVTGLRPRAEFVRARGLVASSQHPGLRAQDGRSPQVPPRIAFLFEGSVVPAHREAEARVVWLEARQRAAERDVPAGEELNFLAAGLAVPCEQRGDVIGARALLEASLAALPVPRQRAVALGRLVRLAVRQRDLAAAEAWGACFEAGTDLESDSELRVSHAAIATLREDWAEVSRLLGVRSGEVAIENGLDPFALLLRVHALEMSGQRDLAIAELEPVVSQVPGAHQALKALADFNAALGLCPRTLPTALGGRQKAVRSSSGGGGGVLGWLMLVIALAPFVITGGIWVAGGGMPVLLPLFMVIPAVAVTPTALRLIRSGRRERAIAQRGVPAVAVVLGSERTSLRVNSVPEMRIHVEVLLDPPVRSTVQAFVDVGSQHMLTPGTQLRVRIDPASPDYAILDG